MTRKKDRWISLLDDGGSVLSGAEGMIASFVIYPTDEESRRQAFAHYALEADRYRAHPESYRPSIITQQLLQVISKTAGQRAACGFTMLAFQMLFMIEKDSQVSLYRAAQVVDRALRRAAELNYQPTRLIHFSDDEWKLKDIRIPSGQDDIRKAYRKYASVAHLIAADMLCSEIFEPALMFARTPEMNAVFINTASVMEDVMRTRQPDHFKDAWLVSPNQSDEVKASGHAPFEGNLVTFLGLGLNTN